MKKSDLLLLSGALLLAAGFLIAATWPITEKSLPSMLLISGTGALFMALGLYQGETRAKGQNRTSERCGSLTGGSGTPGTARLPE